jgi:hypothetical protein
MLSGKATTGKYLKHITVQSETNALELKFSINKNSRRI